MPHQEGSQPRVSLANPFRPTERTPLEPAGTLVEVFDREDLDPEQYITVCNGEVLPPERAIDLVLQDGDDIHLVPVLRNSALRTIALIGVQIGGAFLAPGLGNFIGGVLFTSLSTVAQNVIAGALISVGGSLLVNGIAALFQKPPGGSNYGVLGPSTTARSGIPIPKGYGTMRSAGNIVESWVDIMGDNGDGHDVDDGADTIGRQYVNCRVDFGWGPARAVNNILLNGKDIAEYADVAYVVLLGTNDQLPVTGSDPRWIVLNRTRTGTTTNNIPTTGFDTVNNNYAQNQRIRAGIQHNFVVVPGQRTDTQKLTVYVSMPQGCWRYDDNMVIKRLAIDYDVYYRPTGTGDAGWIHAQHHYYYNIRQTILRQATIIDSLTPGCYDVKVVKNGSGAVNNPLDNFEHESNKFGDELWLESVQETSYTTLSYPNFIQICLRFMATDQLAGSDVNLTADITYGLRQTLPAALANLPEDAPAAVAYDILADDVIGADMDPTRIDLNFFAAWGAHTQTLVDNGDGGTQRRAVFNGVFQEDKLSIWRALQTVAAMSYANMQRIGTTVTGYLDAPDIPVQMFHMGNILRDSYKCTFLDLPSRTQEIEATFADAADNYKTRNPLRLVTAANQASGVELKKDTLDLLGCTDRVQAYYRCLLMLHENEDILRTHVWRSNAQAIRCRVGNAVLLQHDRPVAGWGGLVLPGSTASVLRLQITEPLPFDTGSIYTVLIQHPAFQRAPVAILGISGNVLTVSGYDGSEVLRLQQGAIDTAIDTAIGNQITVRDAAGIVPGAAQLWDLDFRETRTVTAVSIAEDVATVTLAEPLSTVPEDFAGFIYQSTLREAINVRIRSIKKTIGDQRYEITAVDYSDGTYTLPAPSPGMSYTAPALTAGSTGTGNTAQAILSAVYTTSFDSNGNEQYSVTGILIQNPGAGYTATSKAVLGSDYDNIHFNGVGAGSYQTDPDQTLSLALGTGGAITAATGFDTGTVWHAAPYVTLAK